MRPRLEHTTTSDGVELAYAVAGEGPPLLRMSGGLWDHALGYWDIEPMRRQLERLAAQFTHIAFDARGTGLSQRGVFDYSIDAQIRDVEAVLAANGIERTNILAHLTASMGAMAFAARHPERVSKLVLIRPHLRGTDYYNDRVIRALATYRQMAAEDWQGYLNTVTNRAMRFERPDIARQLAAIYDQSMTPETLRRFEEHYTRLNVTDCPSAVLAPTLIIVESGPVGLTNEVWREIAATIPNVSLVMIRPSMPTPYSQEATDAVLAFLGGDETAAARAAAELLQVVLFISLEAAQGRYEPILQEVARARGALRSSAVDGGYLITFRSAQMALQTAADLQNAFTGQGDPARIRIGVDAIDQSASRGPEGAARPRAALLAAAADAGQVLVTDVVRQLVTGKGFRFAARSPLDQGSEEPLAVHELSWQT